MIFLLLQKTKILLIISFIVSSVLKLKGNGHEEHYNYNICVLYIMYQGFNNHGVNIWGGPNVRSIKRSVPHNPNKNRDCHTHNCNNSGGNNNRHLLRIFIIMITCLYLFFCQLLMYFWQWQVVACRRIAIYLYVYINQLCFIYWGGHF